MDHIPATVAGSWAFAKAVSLLSDGATKHLHKGDVGSDVIRKKIIGELLEVRDSLSSLSLKELETARFQLENGLILCQQEANSYAASEFEAARRNAETAFSAVHELNGKIEATKMAMMAALYQYDDNLNIAHTLCMQYLRRLHELPELRETVRIHMYGSPPMTLAEASEWFLHLYWLPKGSVWPLVKDFSRVCRSLKDWITQTDRKALFESVCRLNLILGVFFLKNKILEDLQEWPSITVPEHDPIYPLDHILTFDRMNHHAIRSQDPGWDIELLDGEDESAIVCLCRRTKSPIEVMHLDTRSMTESCLLRLKYWPCVLHAVNKMWIVIVGQKQGMCMVSALNRMSWRFDREKEIACQQNNNNNQLVRVLNISLCDDSLYLLQRNGSITHIDMNTMRILDTTSLHLQKDGPNPYAKGFEFDEPLDEYELDFLQRTDKIKVSAEQTAMIDNQLVLVRNQITLYEVNTCTSLMQSRSEELDAGLDVVVSMTNGYICLLYIRNDDDSDIRLANRPGCDLEIRNQSTLEVIATRKMPYFRQSRSILVEQEGDFLAVIGSRTLSLWELNSATLLAEYTFTMLEPISIKWVNGRFLFVTFSGGVVCRYEIMS